jgi:hypothetical protein
LPTQAAELPNQPIESQHTFVHFPKFQVEDSSPPSASAPGALLSRLFKTTAMPASEAISEEEVQDGICKTAPKQTTVALKNVRKEWRRPMLVEYLAKKGFAGRIDFCYLPMNFRSGENFGYAFLNLRDNLTAQELLEELKDEGFEVCPAEINGKEANIERWRNNSIMHKSVLDECKPALYDEAGRQVPFPPPTQPVSKPRIHWSAQNQSPDHGMKEAMTTASAGKGNGKGKCPSKKARKH